MNLRKDHYRNTNRGRVPGRPPVAGGGGPANALSTGCRREWPTPGSAGGTRAWRGPPVGRRGPGTPGLGLQWAGGIGERRSERPPLGKGAAAPEATGPRPARLPPWFYLLERSVDAPRRGHRRGLSEVMDRARKPTPVAKRQFSAVDHSARAPMKNAASCENQCELQNAVIIGISNAHGGPGPPRPGPRPPEGRRQTRNRRGPGPGPRRESAGRQPRGGSLPPREDTGCRRHQGRAKSGLRRRPHRSPARMNRTGRTRRQAPERERERERTGTGRARGLPPARAGALPGGVRRGVAGRR